VLQSILKKAKAERHAFKKKIKAAEDKLVLEKHRIEKEEIRFQIDREIFAKILQVRPWAEAGGPHLCYVG
jgi:hypothetical protein